MDLGFYKGKKVFVTGHTGFKGSWLITFLDYLGANVTGYSLAPNTDPSHFLLLNNNCVSTIGNILDSDTLSKALDTAQPDIIFHLAAQPLVRQSYVDPVNTYQTNVMGTLGVLEAAKKCSSVKAIVCITTDKVYENIEQHYAYKETDRLGGYDMYSSSKACCELLISSYRNSFLNIDDYEKSHHILIAVARAGNVIGGGDWSKDRLIPDIVKAAAADKIVPIRNPAAIRPWQHVLDCIFGYLLLGQKLLNKEKEVAEPWNFSPGVNEVKTVAEVIDIAKGIWPKIKIETVDDTVFHEASLLQLDNSKAINELGWKPAWNTETAIEQTINWYKHFYENKSIVTVDQIRQYLSGRN